MSLLSPSIMKYVKFKELYLIKYHGINSNINNNIILYILGKIYLPRPFINI